QRPGRSRTRPDPHRPRQHRSRWAWQEPPYSATSTRATVTGESRWARPETAGAVYHRRGQVSINEVWTLESQDAPALIPRSPSSKTYASNPDIFRGRRSDLLRAAPLLRYRRTAHGPFAPATPAAFSVVPARCSVTEPRRVTAHAEYEYCEPVQDASRASAAR